MSDPKLGIGNAPTRATTFPDDAKGRKERPVVSGVFDYFPDALVAIAEVSWAGNEQHNPGKPLHWDRSKSGDEADCLGRHLLQRGTRDTDGKRHSAKMAWRALALLQKEIESEKEEEARRYKEDQELKYGRFPVCSKCLADYEGPEHICPEYAVRPPPVKFLTDDEIIARNEAIQCRAFKDQEVTAPIDVSMKNLLESHSAPVTHDINSD